MAFFTGFGRKPDTQALAAEMHHVEKSYENKQRAEVWEQIRPSRQIGESVFQSHWPCLAL